MRRKLFATAILIGYLATLATSAGHLAEWYTLSRGNLHPILPYALALTLEANAFILSLLSNYTLKGSRWALGGSLVALALVWLGNYMSMLRASNGQLMGWEVLAASMFVPVGTYVMGKVLGEVLAEENVAQKTTPKLEDAEKYNTYWDESKNPTLTEESVVTIPSSNYLIREITQFLTQPRTANEIYTRFSGKRSEVREALRQATALNLVRFQEGYWRRNDS